MPYEGQIFEVDQRQKDSSYPPHTSWRIEASIPRQRGHQNSPHRRLRCDCGDGCARQGKAHYLRHNEIKKSVLDRVND